MTLAADVARCAGIELADCSLDQVCAVYQRRTDRSAFPLLVWMSPPPAQPCAQYIPRQSEPPQ